MGIVVFCFLIGFVVGYLWGHEDGRLKEFGRQMDNREATLRREMDMDRLYSQEVEKLEAELDYYKRLARENK